MKIKIYVSGRTAHVAEHTSLKKFLEQNLNCEVFLPHDFVPNGIPKEKFPREVFLKCVEFMNKSDLIVANVGNYGKDTAWEIGYCHANGKPVIALAKTDEHLADFMVKGAFDHVVRSE